MAAAGKELMGGIISHPPIAITIPVEGVVGENEEEALLLQPWTMGLENFLPNYSPTLPLLKLRRHRRLIIDEAMLHNRAEFVLQRIPDYLP